MEKELKQFLVSFNKAGYASGKEKERIKLDQKYNKDAIREFWNMMQDADAVLVANFDKNGIKNYIGGNTLMEIGFAYVLPQKIFL